MSHDLVALVFGAHRLAFYVGYVLLAGTVTFWVLVWPEGPRDRKLRLLAAAGTVLVGICTVIGPILRVDLEGVPLETVLSPLAVAAFVLRLFGLAAAVALLWVLPDGPVVGIRRVLGVSAVALIAVSMVTESNAVGGAWQLVKLLATTGHILAVSAWLGGLVALAAVLIPREFLTELDRLIPRFSRVATVSIVVLAVTGLVHAVAVAHGVRPLLDSRYGLVLAVKIAIFGLMLLLGNHGRLYARRVAFRARHQNQAQLQVSSGVHQLAVVMGAEVSIAFTALAVTVLLVLVAPHP